MSSSSSTGALPNEQRYTERVTAYRTFHAEHGRYPKQTADDRDERSLGNWMADQRDAARNGSLTTERAAQLDAARPGWRIPSPARYVLNPQRLAHFHSRVAAYRDFRAEHNHDPSHYRGKSELERSLSSWLNRQRQAARRGTLPADRVAELDAVNPGWLNQKGEQATSGRHRVKAHRASRVEQYRAFRVEHGRDPVNSPTDKNERSLARWLMLQRDRRSRSGDDVTTARLDEVSPAWRGRKKPVYRSFSESVDLYRDFLYEREHDPSQSADDAEEARLGIWLYTQRNQARKGEMSVDRQSMLDEVNPDWRTSIGRTHHWKYVDHLTNYDTFRHEHGHDPAAASSDQEESRLGNWLSSQRTLARKGELSPDRQSVLDDMQARED